MKFGFAQYFGLSLLTLGIAGFTVGGVAKLVSELDGNNRSEAARYYKLADAKFVFEEEESDAAKVEGYLEQLRINAVAPNFYAERLTIATNEPWDVAYYNTSVDQPQLRITNHDYHYIYRDSNLYTSLATDATSGEPNTAFDADIKSSTFTTTPMTPTELRADSRFVRYLEHFVDVLDHAQNPGVEYTVTFGYYDDLFAVKIVSSLETTIMLADIEHNIIEVTLTKTQYSHDYFVSTGENKIDIPTILA
jgi:hypothetical protein